MELLEQIVLLPFRFDRLTPLHRRLDRFGGLDARNDDAAVNRLPVDIGLTIKEESRYSSDQDRTARAARPSSPSLDHALTGWPSSLESICV